MFTISIKCLGKEKRPKKENKTKTSESQCVKCFEVNGKDADPKWASNLLRDLWLFLIWFLSGHSGST